MFGIKHEGRYIYRPWGKMFAALKWMHVSFAAMLVATFAYLPFEAAKPAALVFLTLWGSGVGILLLMNRRTYELTAKGEIDRNQIDTRRSSTFKNFLKHWYVRYPMALGLVAVGVWLFSTVPEGASNKKTIVTSVAALSYVVFAFFVAFEVGRMVLGLATAAAVAGVGYLLFSGMNVVEAIVLGSIIIAMAILAKK